MNCRNTIHRIFFTLFLPSVAYLLLRYRLRSTKKLPHLNRYYLFIIITGRIHMFKKNHNRWLAVAFAIAIFLNACKENNTLTPTATTMRPMTTGIGSGYSVTYLVADTAGFGTARIDAQLVNAWGISVSPSGTFWLSDNGSGLSSVYDKNGNQRLPAVQIPSRTAPTGGVPTGNIFNGTSDFALPSGGAGRFIFAGEDGIIAAWGGGNAAIRVAMSSQPQAVYKGI